MTQLDTRVIRVNDQQLMLTILNCEQPFDIVICRKSLEALVGRKINLHQLICMEGFMTFEWMSPTYNEISDCHDVTVELGLRDVMLNVPSFHTEKVCPAELAGSTPEALVVFAPT